MKVGRPAPVRAPVAPIAESKAGAEDVAPSRPSGSRGFAALRSRNFRLLWSGLIISNAGTWMATTAEGWLVTELVPERAAFSLGLIAISFAIPMLLLPPIGGAVADRVPRLRLLWVVQSLYLVLSSILAVLTLTDAITVWMLMGYAFLNGTVLAFDGPCRHALLPDIVSRDQLASAVSLNSAAFTGAALIGPSVAGALIPLIGVGGVFVVNALSGLAVLWALTRLSGVAERPSRHDPPEGVLRSILEGARFVQRDPRVRGLLLVSVIVGFFGRSYSPLLAVFARDVFASGSVAFGFLVAAPGLGTLCGALGLAGMGDVAGRGRWIWRGTMVFALALFAFALVGWYPLALPLLVLVGMSSTVAAALLATVVQLHVPNELRGRVMSLYMLTVIGVPSAGALLAGVVADAASVRVAVASGAVIVLALTTIVFLRNEHLREAV